MHNMNLFIDTTNLYYNAKKRYGGIVDYEALLDTISPERINIIYVYIARMSVKSDGFIKYIENVVSHNQNIIRVKEPFPVKINGQQINMVNFNVELTIDALHHRGEQGIIFSSDYNLLSLLPELHDPTIQAINIPREFREYADAIEVTENFIKATNGTPSTT